MDFQSNTTTREIRWPFPVNYDAVHHVKTDVLIVGGGIVGASAAIQAARRGVKVAIIDKAAMKRSGCGGAGLDHYNHIQDNPKTPINSEEYMERGVTYGKDGHAEYIQIKGAYDFLLELERLGMPIRDEDDDFAGAPTRDEDTKLLKAYD